MKNISLIILVLIFTSCMHSSKNEDYIISNKDITPLEINDTTIDKNLLTYQKEKSIWTLNGKQYSGYAITKYDNDSLKRKFGILNGKKQNEDIVWFSDRKINSIANYHKGKLHGEKKIWTTTPAYTLVAHYNYYLGKGHGKQIKWYTTGELFQIINLEIGKEKGIQQAFRKNGKLYANYEAKNGRVFGLKKASLCFGVEDEKTQDNN